MKVSFTAKRSEVPPQRDAQVTVVRDGVVFPWVRFCLILLLFFSPVFFFLYRVTLPWFIVESPGAISIRRMSVTMPVTGTVLSVEASEGTRTEGGAVLFYIEDAASTILRERVELLRARQPLLEEDVVSNAGGISKKALALAEQSVGYYRRKRFDVEELFRRGAATSAELNAAREAERKAQRELLRLQEGARTDQSTYDRNLLSLFEEQRQIEEELRRLEAQAVSRDVVSPMEGTIESVNAAIGDVAAGGTVLATIADTARPLVVAFADSNAFPFVKRGNSVRVIFPGGKTIPARVERLFGGQQGGVGESGTIIMEGRPVLRVQLLPLENVPEEYLTGGLPVTVRWAARLPDFLKQYLLKEEDE